MSWSIYLSGKSTDVKAELGAAQDVIGDARVALQGVTTPTVVVSVSGHGYTNDDGSCTFSASYSVSGIVPATPVATAPAEAVSADALSAVAPV